MEIATAKLKEAMSQEREEARFEEWDPDAWEQEVRQFSRQLGQQRLQTWAEVRTDRDSGWA